jgi:hypothetical protein
MAGETGIILQAEPCNAIVALINITPTAIVIDVRTRQAGSALSIEAEPALACATFIPPTRPAVGINLGAVSTVPTINTKPISTVAALAFIALLTFSTDIRALLAGIISS